MTDRWAHSIIIHTTKFIAYRYLACHTLQRAQNSVIFAMKTPIIVKNNTRYWTTDLFVKVCCRADSGNSGHVSYDVPRPHSKSYTPEVFTSGCSASAEAKYQFVSWHLNAIGSLLALIQASTSCKHRENDRRRPERRLMARRSGSHRHTGGTWGHAEQ